MVRSPFCFFSILPPFFSGVKRGKFGSTIAVFYLREKAISRNPFKTLSLLRAHFCTPFRVVRWARYLRSQREGQGPCNRVCGYKKRSISVRSVNCFTGTCLMTWDFGIRFSLEQTQKHRQKSAGVSKYQGQLSTPSAQRQPPQAGWVLPMQSS